MCVSPSDLEALHADALPPDRKRDVTLHVEGCWRCRRELSALRSNNRLADDIRRAFKRDATDASHRADGAARPNDRRRAPSIDGYEILEELHCGGQGVVYKARQNATRRTVALKLLLHGPYASAREHRRFEREIDLVANLNHPNIVTVHDRGHTGDDRHFFVMEYVDGRPLDQYISDSNLSLRESLRLFCKICAAVNHAHQHGVIHRDLKPANILIDRDGEPHILDFGLAKHTRQQPEGSGMTVTLPGEFMGTPAYASPEQARGEATPIDLRTDVYSLGVSLYQMLTGAYPYDVNGRISEVLDNIVDARPRRPTGIRGRINNEIETIVLKALAKDPQRRYQSADALREDIERYLVGRPIEAKRDSGWYVLKKTLRRYRVGVAIASLFLILLGVTSASLVVLYARAEREAESAGRVHEFLASLLASASLSKTGPDVRLLEVLDSAEELIAGELAGRPDIEAEVRLVIGSTYMSLLNLSAAERHLNEALKLNRDVYGRENLPAAACLHLLGDILMRTSQSRSVDQLRAALAIRTHELGDTHPLVAESQTSLAAALWRTQSPPWGEAERQFQQALDTIDRLGHDGLPHKARCLYELAAMRTAQHALPEAESRFAQALTLFRALDDTRGYYYAHCVDAYARLLVSTGNYVEAEPLLRETVKVMPAVLGAENEPQLIWRYGNLKHAQGDLEAAERLYRDALAQSCVGLADQYPKQSEDLQRFGAEFLAGRDEPSRCVPYLDLFNLMSSMRGLVHPALVLGLLDLADLYRDRKNSPMARKLAAGAVALAQRVLPPQHVYLSRAQRDFGTYLADAGDYAEAERSLLTAHEMFMRVCRRPDQRTLAALRRVAEAYEADGNTDRADALRAVMDRAGRGRSGV